MVKVCHMTSAHQALDDRIFYKECVSLAKAGYEVYLIAQGENGEKDGVHIIGMGDMPLGRRQRMTQFAKAVYQKALTVDAEIYHVHDPELLPYALKLKKHGKKVIFDSHENYCLQIMNKEYIPKPFCKMVSGLYRSYETRVVKAIDAVIVPCTFEGKNIFEGRANQTVFIANYPQNCEFYDKYDATIPREKYVAYVGGLSQDRGIIPLIRACGQAQTQLVLAGSFSPPELETELQSLPEYKYVDYRGVVGRGEVAKINASAMAGACTLLRTGQYDKADTFGVKVYEYMAMGLPVLLTDYPYAKRVMDTYRFGLCVDSSNANDVADAIRYLRDHPEEARQMGENGRCAVREEFNWGTQEERLLELYELLCEEKHLLT